MSTPRIPAPLQSPASPSGEARPVLRAKTIATRVTPEELAEVETAAEGAGKTLAEWLRELALKAARERPADPTELVLAEVSALRYMLLNLFHATAQANAEGKHLPPDSVVKIRDLADAQKLEKARRLLQPYAVSFILRVRRWLRLRDSEQLCELASSILTGRSLGRVQFLKRCGTTA
jgi:uncharacterized protein (DUF1778 family)